MGRSACLGCVFLYGTALALAASEQAYDRNLPVDHPAIQYSKVPPEDRAANLAARISGGAVKLDFAPRGLGYLPSLLRELQISVDSQGLVFSKTSFQHAQISPRNPRAVYFNDEAAVGFVPGSDAIEVAAVDPRQGVVFYALEGDGAKPPTLTRRDVCLRCHQGPATFGVPGFFVSSVFPSSSGLPDAEGAIVTDHRTPFADRWGGWYVTGTHGSARHRGNAVAPNPAEPTVLETAGTQNLTNLTGRFDTAAYLSPVSDIVALMTFEHQTQMTNLMTRLGWEGRMGEPRLDARVEDVVRYMLFLDEAPLREPVGGASSFSRTFAERGPRDRRKRSLRDFDLKRRLFRYPLSFMIYSGQFDALPDDVKARVYRRLYEMLRSLRPADRTSILEILRETKSDLPSYFSD